MATKYGQFSEHPHHALGPGPGAVEVQGEGTAAMKGTRSMGEAGLSMKAGTLKTGKLNDATFSKFLPLSEGDRYVDPLRAALKANAAQKGRNIADVPFRAPAPLKKSACPGDYFGTSGRMPHAAGCNEPVHRKKGEVPEQPKGIYTSPAKKGTFGFNKTTLSERQGYKGVATEYEYQHEPSALHEQRQREERAANRKAQVTDAPFKPSNPPKKGSYGTPNTTISKGQGVVGEWGYVVGSHQPTTSGRKDKDAPPAPAPFHPSNAFAAQHIQRIEYLHDPEAPKIKAEAERRKSETARLAASGPWRPNMGGCKTDMVRSIVRMNLR